MYYNTAAKCTKTQNTPEIRCNYHGEHISTIVVVHISQTLLKSREPKLRQLSSLKFRPKQKTSFYNKPTKTFKTQQTKTTYDSMNKKPEINITQVLNYLKK